MNEETLTNHVLLFQGKEVLAVRGQVEGTFRLAGGGEASNASVADAQCGEGSLRD